jgi:hypothetical protein
MTVLVRYTPEGVVYAGWVRVWRSLRHASGVTTFACDETMATTIKALDKE